MGRTPYLIAELMPGLTTNTPSPNQLTISGGFAYDNVFLVDGVDVNDNLLGSMNDLYIEDAVGEVQVLTSGVTAEYGRFSGGVVNVITKSGSNMFAGSYRSTFTRPSWSKETPFESANNIERGKPTHGESVPEQQAVVLQRGDRRRPAVEGSRVVFRGRALRELVDVRHDAGDGGARIRRRNDSKRYEGKLTGTPAPGPHAAGQLHRQPRAPRERAGAVVQHRQGGADFAVGAQSPWRRQLQRRVDAAHAGVGAVLAEGLGDRRGRRHVDQHPRFAVPDAHRHAVSVQRAVLRRERPRTAQQPSVDGERHATSRRTAVSAATS